MERSGAPWWSRLAPAPPRSERELWICVVLFAVLAGLFAGLAAVRLMP
jgi:hypothetical protein